MKTAAPRRFPFLSSGALTLYRFDERHARDPRYVSCLSGLESAKLTHRTGDFLPADPAAVRRYYKTVAKEKDSAFFAALRCEDGAFIGTLKVFKIHPLLRSAELGMLVFPEFRGKGYGKEMIRVAVDYCFKTLHLNRVSAAAIAANVASCRCFETNGFKREGVLRRAGSFEGRFVDIHMYGLLKGESK